MSDIEAKIDQLYQRPLSEFTAARNALAKELPKSDAAHVRKLLKPAAAAWAVNQLYWRHRSTYDRLCDAGDRLRAAQVATLEGRPADVRGAMAAHGKALADAVKTTSRLAEAAKIAVSSELFARTLDALSLAPEPREAPGRLIDPPQPAGFEVLAGVRPRPAPTVVEASPARKAEKGPDKLEQEWGEAMAALKQAETAGTEMHQRMLEAQRREAQARDAWERTKGDLDASRANFDRATAATASARQRLDALKAR